MEELQNSTVKQKIVAVLIMMAIGVAFFGVVGGLGNAFEYFFRIPTKSAVPLALIATPIVIFIVYVVFAIVLDRFLEPWAERKYQQKTAKTPE